MVDQYNDKRPLEKSDKVFKKDLTDAAGGLISFHTR